MSSRGKVEGSRSVPSKLVWDPSTALGMNEENLLGEATEAEKMTIRSSAFA
jgi:hypothetical protein